MDAGKELLLEKFRNKGSYMYAEPEPTCSIESEEQKNGRKLDHKCDLVYFVTGGTLEMSSISNSTKKIL